jgi:uncharacterized protein (TIGR02145 family)
MSKRTTTERKDVAKTADLTDTEQESIVEQKHNEESSRNITLVATVLMLLITLAGSVFFDDLILGKSWRLLVCLVVILCVVPWSRFSWQRLKLVIGPMLGICLGPMIGNWLHSGAVGGSIGLVAGVILGRLAGDWWLRNSSRITTQVVQSPSIETEILFEVGVTSGHSVETHFTDPRDGNVYRIVKIGNQVWMAENLRYKIDGSCCYNNDESNCQEYGRLYNWETAKKACPPGWHLPTRTEWDALSEYAKTSEKVNWNTGSNPLYRWPGAGTKLMSKTGWANNGNGTDDFGFAALPGGFRIFVVSFYHAGYYGYWWTATELDASFAYYRSMGYDNDYAIDCSNYKEYGLSVRCVKNDILDKPIVPDHSLGDNFFSDPVEIPEKLVVAPPRSWSCFGLEQVKVPEKPVGAMVQSSSIDNDILGEVCDLDNSLEELVKPILLGVKTRRFQAKLRFQQFTDPRDGNVYRIVKIGNQVWMAENLRYKIGGSWCYDNDESNCQNYGRLYDWKTARTICPAGWHLPTRQEWDGLCQTVGGLRKPDSRGNIDWCGAGKKLKSTSGWNNNGNGTDDFGFSALPGGYRYAGGNFRNAGNYGNWWTATEYDAPYAYYRNMNYGNVSVNENDSDKENGFAVRCVEDYLPEITPLF